MAKNKTEGRVCTDWADYEKTVFSPEEIAASDFRAALMCEIIEARKAGKYSTKELGALSGVSKSVIARLERGNGAKITEVLKVLAVLGKTLKIVAIEKDKN